MLGDKWPDNDYFFFLLYVHAYSYDGTQFQSPGFQLI